MSARAASVLDVVQVETPIAALSSIPSLVGATRASSKQKARRQRRRKSRFPLHEFLGDPDAPIVTTAMLDVPLGPAFFSAVPKITFEVIPPLLETKPPMTPLIVSQVPMARANGWDDVTFPILGHKYQSAIREYCLRIVVGR